MRTCLPDQLATADAEAVITNDSEIHRLYLRHGALVHRTLRAKISDDHVVDDLAAQTWECAMRLAQQGRIGELQAGWFVVVANRRVIDYWRRRGSENRRNKALQNEAVVLASVESEIVALDNGVPEISALLVGIGERQRRALVLRYLQSGSVSEVAATMGLSYAATESLLARARRSARQRMAKTPVRVVG